MRTAPLLAAFLALIAASGGAGQAADPAPVAVVYSLAGEAAVISPVGERRPLRLFDRLVSGTVVETGPGSRLTLAFADGRRYELGERSRATLRPAGLTFRSGTVRALPSVPPHPRLEPIADEDPPGLRAGAVRIRGEKTTRIYPGPAAPPPTGGEEAPRASPGDPAAVAAVLAGVERLLVKERVEQGAAVVWLLAQATALDEARRGEEADALYSTAAGEAAALGEEESVARILHAWGSSLQKRGSWSQAEDLYRRALELDRAAGRDLAAAGTLHDLGTMKAQRGDSPAAEDFLRQALEIRERLAPRSAGLAKTLANLGNVSKLRNELAAAEDYLRRALAIQEEIDPGGFASAGTMINLGYVVLASLDDAEAETLFRRARAIYGRLRPESLEMARALKALGFLAVGRGDAETADLYLRQALAIEEKLDPSGASLVGTLVNLGLQALAHYDLETAEDYLRRAVRLNEKLAPDGLSVAHTLQNLGSVLVEKRECAEAGEILRRALAIRQKLAPGSFEEAASLKGLGNHAFDCGDLAAAEDFFRGALAIYGDRAPYPQAMALHDLGEVYQRQGRLSAAMEHICRAAALFQTIWEAGKRREGYDEAFFNDCARAQAEAGRTAAAFDSMERGRARVLLQRLAERDLLGSGGLSEGVARKRSQLARELDATQAALARLDARPDPVAARRLLDRQREVRDQQQELAAQIRQSSLRFASLRDPEPLDLAGVRQTLDPGTVLLSYLVVKEKTFLFVVHPAEAPDPGLTIFPIAAGRAELEEAVRSMRNLFETGGSDLEALRSRAAALYGLLLAPAEAEIAPARRLLISPHGPLHTLPFAALMRQGRYLAEWKPIHSVVSATVYAGLKRERRAIDFARGELVAFGDPVYPRLQQDRDTVPAATLEILTAVRRGLSLDPIPATRAEVEGIAALFPRVHTYLGGEATEERAKSLPAQARFIHFASHGLLDERFPLNSALALTVPEHPEEGQENGLLQAWEIIDGVRLDADLVTLSACDTALGKEDGTGGLVGLTRAFQYAGARSVLASLWSVPDVSTADFMKSFYGHLRAGKAKDEALQAAQIALIRSSGFPHPYHWAAFQLSGDWR